MLLGQSVCTVTTVGVHSCGGRYAPSAFPRTATDEPRQQHYADGEEASPQLYSEMTAEDRRLRLRGYEVCRFAGFELSQPQPTATLRAFFDDLFEKHITT